MADEDPEATGGGGGGPGLSCFAWMAVHEVASDQWGEYALHARARTPRLGTLPPIAANALLLP